MRRHRHVTPHLTLWCAVLWAGIAAAAYPPPTGHVNDFARVMRREAVTQLETVLTELQQRTGAEVAVATVPTVPDGSIEQAAVDLFKEWGVGKQGKDNGVLILCAVQDRKVRIEVGYGLEPVLPDAQCGRIIRDVMVPSFRAGDFSAGLLGGGIAVAQIIAQHAGATLTTVPTGAPSAPPVNVGRKWASLLVQFGLLFAVGLLMNRLIYGFWFALYLGGDRTYCWGGRYGWGGGSGGGFGSGGFGGFGGGGSGGGGASGSW